MKSSSNCVSVLLDPKSRSCLCSLFITASLICGAYFLRTAFLAKDFRVLPRLEIKVNLTKQNRHSTKCENRCRPFGSEALPEGIVARTSNLGMRPLWGSVAVKKSKKPVNLFAVAVGIKQKELVDRIVKKFLENDFVIMIFHYDGVVDEWSDLQWSNHVIHVSAMNQTKWWFAKRFLHPDIVAEYDYVFLWDEDLGVENFHPRRYISIVKGEGLEISQPALDPTKSKVHHQITGRQRNSRVHRRFYKLKGGRRCDSNSTTPPCVGWVEMMAPVFSRAAWRCAWYLIQNDLIHAWGLDMQLGYCAQGDRTKNVGVVDSEYVVHLARPTLGGLDGNRGYVQLWSHAKESSNSGVATSAIHKFDNRSAVRRQSYVEMKMFKNRWINAVHRDQCWVDPY